MSLDPVSALLDIGNTIITRLFPDPAQAAQAQLALLKMQQDGELAAISGQMEINKVEAASGSVFVAGARPFIIWVCGIGFAMQFIVSPILTWGSALLGKPIILPPLDMGTLMTMLGGLLGLGAMRTVEKLNGVASIGIGK
jgi:hypothetical protein